MKYSDILKESVTLLRKNLRYYLSAFLIIWLPVNLIIAIFNFYYGGDELAEFRNVIIIAGIWSPILQAALYYITYHVKENNQLSVRKAVLFGLSKWIPIIIAGVIAGFIISFSLILIVPGIFFLVRYSFLEAVVCFQEDRKEPARLISYFLTKGYFWRIFSVGLTFIFVYLTAAFILISIPVQLDGYLGQIVPSAKSFLADLTLIPSHIAVVVMYMDAVKNKKNC
jgi:hypothetical protein